MRSIVETKKNKKKKKNNGRCAAAEEPVRLVHRGQSARSVLCAYLPHFSRRRIQQLREEKSTTNNTHTHTLCTFVSYTYTRTRRSRFVRTTIAMRIIRSVYSALMIIYDTIMLCVVRVTRVNPTDSRFRYERTFWVFFFFLKSTRRGTIILKKKNRPGFFVFSLPPGSARHFHNTRAPITSCWARTML